MKNNKVIFFGSLFGKGMGFAGAVFDANGCCPTLTTMQGGGREPHILVSKGKNTNQFKGKTNEQK